MIVKEYSTKSRKNILTFLEINKERAVSVADISLYLNDISINTDNSTIYRYLEKLCINNVIKKYIGIDSKTSTFQFIGKNSTCDNHLHLQCLNCGKTIHLDCEIIKSVSSHISLKHDFNIEYSSSILYGYCKECQKIK